MEGTFKESILSKEEQPNVITAKEKDQIAKTLLTIADGKGKVVLRYQDVSELKMSKDQFDLVIKQFKKNGLLEDTGGYGDKYTLTADLHDKYRIGAFEMQEVLMLQQIDKLIKEMDKLINENNTGKMRNIAQSLSRSLTTIKDCMSVFVGADNLIKTLEMHLPHLNDNG